MRYCGAACGQFRAFLYAQGPDRALPGESLVTGAARQHDPQHFPMCAQARRRFTQLIHMVVHSKARNTFSGPAGRQQRASVPVLARGGRHAGRGSGLGLVDIVRDGGRWSSRTGGPRTQAPACCHAHRDPAGGASSIRSSCPGSVAAGAGDPPPALPRPGAGALGAGPLDDRVQQAITGQQRPTPGHWPRRRLAAFPYLGQRGSTASRSAALPGRAQEAGRKIPDHHTQPGLAPSHYRTAPSEISGPSDPGSAAVRSGRADAARATRGTQPCGPALRPSCTGLLPARPLPRSRPPGRGRPRTRPCCVLTPDRRGWHSGVAGVPALAKTFLPGRIRQGPSMYEMEGPCPASPRLLASCLVFAAPRAARRGQVPARGPVSGSSHVPGVAPGWCPFPAVKAFLLPPQPQRKALRPAISYFSAIHEGIHRKQAVIRISQRLSTGLFTTCPQATGWKPEST